VLGRILAPGLVALAGLLVALLALEAGLRVLYPRMGLLTRHERLGTMPRAHLDGRLAFGGHERVVHISTNSLGLRGPELVPKPAGVRRVLALGDSYTFGHAVEAAETWPAVLQRRLNSGGASRWEVVNAGVSGHGTGQQLLMYELLEDRVEPDAVVLGFAVVNDVLDNLCVEGEQFGGRAEIPCFRVDDGRLVAAPPRRALEAAGGTWWPRPQVAELFMAQAKRATLWNPRFLTLAQSLGIRVRDARLLPDTVASWFDPRFVEDGWPLTRRLLQELRARLQSRGTPLVVLLIPAALQVDPSLQRVLTALADPRPPIQAFLSDPHRPQRLLADFCHGEALACVDPLPALLQAARHGERPYYPIDGHWTPAAHALAAAAVLPRLDPAGVSGHDGG
jgi:lysophospholipase L1-like esterase